MGGNSVVTSGFGLPAKHVIHTVSPMFDLKFKTASESALASAYWSCLSSLKEVGGQSIAFDVIHNIDKKYPIDAGAHIALRTLRRFLNKHAASISLIVLCMPCGHHRDIYASVLPLYFPRSPDEALAAVSKLPSDLGDEKGQSILRDRESSLFTSVLSVPVAERESSTLLEASFAEDMVESLGGDFIKMKDDGESAAEH